MQITSHRLCLCPNGCFGFTRIRQRQPKIQFATLVPIFGVSMNPSKHLGIPILNPQRWRVLITKLNFLKRWVVTFPPNTFIQIRAQHLLDQPLEHVKERLVALHHVLDAKPVLKGQEHIHILKRSEPPQPALAVLRLADELLMKLADIRRMTFEHAHDLGPQREPFAVKAEDILFQDAPGKVASDIGDNATLERAFPFRELHHSTPTQARLTTTTADETNHATQQPDKPPRGS
mmetsp:Transcript_3209/g.4629  ORF Transcript_3209/g.4629 Transcript_3209/m.4629 type:complete len:233 (-) Transcript_3209:2-700(-)